jgi:hypothetical protein
MARHDGGSRTKGGQRGVSHHEKAGAKKTTTKKAGAKKTTKK